MRIGRTLPPTAAPIPLLDILRGLPACFRKTTPENPLEKEFIEYFGQKHCFLVSSGKAALTLILTALKELYPERNEVLIPAFTCYSVPAAIKKAGLKVKLCDMAPSSLDIDKDHLQEIIRADRQGKKILCVLVTHLFGCAGDYTGIRKIVGADIPIIEDAAQAMGEELDGKKIGTLSDAGFFSLGRGKALSTMEGGIIITSRDDLEREIGRLAGNLPGYSRIAAIRLAFKTILTTLLLHPLLFWLPKNMPFLKLGETIYEQDFPVSKISPFQRTLARDWDKRLAQHRRARRKNINLLTARLPEGLEILCRNMEGGSMIRLPILAHTTEERDTLAKMSEQAGLGIMSAYPTPIHKIPQLAGDFPDQHYPQAQNICNRLLTIPVHEYVSNRDNKRILNLLAH